MPSAHGSSTRAASASVGAMSIFERRASLLADRDPGARHVERCPRGGRRVLQREALLAPRHAVVGQEDEERRPPSRCLRLHELADGAVDDEQRFAHLRGVASPWPGRHLAHLAAVRVGRVGGWLEGRQRGTRLGVLIAGHDLRRRSTAHRPPRRREARPSTPTTRSGASVGASRTWRTASCRIDVVAEAACPDARTAAVIPEAGPLLRAQHERVVPAGGHDRAVVAVQVLARHHRVVAGRRRGPPRSVSLVVERPGIVARHAVVERVLAGEHRSARRAAQRRLVVHPVRRRPPSSHRSRMLGRRSQDRSSGR